MRIFAALLFALAGVTANAANYSDIWWNPNESGWGLTIADHETNLWAVWYTYRQDNTPTWMFVSGGTFNEARTRFSGPLYQTTGPAYRAAFASRPVNVTQVGNVTIDFAPAGMAAGVATFTYTVGSVTATRQVERYGYGNAAPAWGNDATDLWWDPAESGWGIALTQHGGTLFGVWYTYDDAGQPLFVVLPAGATPASGQFNGDLFTTRGPWFGAPFDASKVVTMPFGTAQITLEATAPISGFTPKRGNWRARFADGTETSKFFTQVGFGQAAPSTPPPPCLNTGTCVTRQTGSSSDQCSYRTCQAALMSDPDYYGYSMNQPCQCSSDADRTACLPSRPAVPDGAACNNGQGCAGGSVCADLRNGMPRICMPQAMFNANYCGAY